MINLSYNYAYGQCNIEMGGTGGALRVMYRGCCPPFWKPSFISSRKILSSYRIDMGAGDPNLDRAAPKQVFKLFICGVILNVSYF